MTSIKITFQGETRRVLLRENGETLNYSQLINTLLNLFPSLCGKTFQLTWEDDDRDLITCSSDAELEDAIHVMTSKSKTLKFGVKLSESGSESNSSSRVPPSARLVHTNVTCDECGMSPIIGVRFKCAVRHDFDLCEGCEAKKLQPYPMIKIVDPLQAPEVLVFGLRDGQRNEEGFGFQGRHWQRGFRHHHHHGPPPVPPTDFNPNPNPSNGGGCRWKRRGGGCEWGRKFEKFAAELSKDVAPFVEAMDSAVKDFMGEGGGEQPCKPTATAAPVSASNTAGVPQAQAESVKPPAQAVQNELEEQLLEQAILESLTINEPLKAQEAGNPVVAAPVIASSASANSGNVVYVETSRPAVPTLPKPALRFVRDVTFPDGTSVQPGAVFRKTWRVRNDGNHPWPEGSALVSVGGDVLSDQSHKESLPVVQPDQEIEIGLQLTAPHLPGMYTSYYRAQTKEQQYFGQRLWAAIVVADSNQGHEDWLEVNNEKALTPVASPTAPVPTAPSEASEEEARQKSEEEPAVVQETVFPVTVVDAPPAVAPTAPQQQPPAHLRSAMLLWRRELAILNDMGFDDVEVILPLLQQHFSSPLSLSADKNAVPNVEGMQQVVATLISLLN